MIETIQFELNGKPTELSIDPNTIMMWVVRNELGLTGTKFGCGMGFCGSCTVILNNEPVRSCMLAISDAEGGKLLTIEGLAKNGSLHPIQQAFVDEGVWIRPFGKLIYLMPPYVIKENELNTLCDKLNNSITQMTNTENESNMNHIQSNIHFKHDLYLNSTKNGTCIDDLCD